MDKITKADIKC